MAQIKIGFYGGNERPQKGRKRRRRRKNARKGTKRCGCAWRRLGGVPGRQRRLERSFEGVKSTVDASRRPLKRNALVRAHRSTSARTRQRQRIRAMHVRQTRLVTLFVVCVVMSQPVRARSRMYPNATDCHVVDVNATKVCCKIGRLQRCFCRNGMRKHCDANQYAVAAYVMMLFLLMHSQLAHAFNAVQIKQRIYVRVAHIN